MLQTHRNHKIMFQTALRATIQKFSNPARFKSLTLCHSTYLPLNLSQNHQSSHNYIMSSKRTKSKSTSRGGRNKGIKQVASRSPASGPPSKQARANSAGNAMAGPSQLRGSHRASVATKEEEATAHGPDEIIEIHSSNEGAGSKMGSGRKSSDVEDSESELGNYMVSNLSFLC
jgi:hypothetical protein